MIDNWVPFLLPREASESFHVATYVQSAAVGINKQYVLNVKPYDITRNFLFAKSGCYFLKRDFTHITKVKKIP